MKIRRRMGETKQIVQVNGGNILLFELAFRLLTLPLLLQAVAALFRLSVRASGYSYVTVSNLVSYLLRPVTIAILVLMAAILLVGVSIEAAGLLAAYQAAALSRKMSAFSMFAAGIRLTVSEIRKRNLRLFLVLAVHGLVLHSFLIYRMLCHVKAVKFILPALLAENWGAAFTGWRDCWRGCDFTSDDFYLFWLYAGAAVVSGRISAKQGAAAR